MIENIKVGASTAAQAQEVNALAGDMPLKLTITPTGRTIIGVGNIGLLEVVDGADLTTAMAQSVQARESLRILAAEKPTALFTFIRT